ncbi:YifB family Mg chelatase-like AAA ATPase [Ruminococcus flavefaciens]|uniref:Magnesium chelatase family protein n=2 Tax=Ruminococcus flavefaciens TaxID=1265 RepID=A0A315YK26_RUMFL|nr:YifB family Mg chelatase-like AAA ATPase [Ruminococcus flavefaciens]MBQ6170169.1 YifB family Mg chelatase-like AAA ATPase [Ruminococcus sp.]PWJ11655.1 magnesium chelatase family protein [Ruminococcus flavefaciens]SSA50564.1 magnesium chelatase family protein [Ruminococcus flavefaciens]
MFAKVSSLGLFGLNAFPVDVEIDISRGNPVFEIVGLPDTVVKESRERIRAALRSCSISFPVASVMINLAPADTKKSGSVHDMAIFMAILRAMRMISEEPDGCSFIGEISLNGDIRRINGVLPMVMLAREIGIKSVFVPAENAKEASVIDGVDIYAVHNAEELIRHFRGEEKLQPCPHYIPPEAAYNEPLDFSDVRGQQSAKKALEIAAAGGHNALLIGSPGSGKSMLAKRMPSILPPLTFEEALETTKIHSISGLLTPEMPIITKRPFRSPHHTISSAGLAGGGTVPHPGEVSLAHNGLLFLDELAEFDRKTLEILRQPLEDRKVTIARASGTVTYPCTIMLIGAMNPCPCGYYGHPKRKCICPKNKVTGYLSKISGPLLDRFDLHIEVAPVEFGDLSSKTKEESSAEIRKRVVAARAIQEERFKGTGITCNALITPDKLQEFCPMDDAAETLMKNVFDRLGLSARAYDRILKVARTIADIDGSEVIRKNHVAAAAQFRSLDRKYWTE